MKRRLQDPRIQRLSETARRWYVVANRRTRGSPEVMQRAVRSFTLAHAAQAAAAIAFFAFFSLFPLLMVLVAFSSGFLESGQIYQKVLDLISRGLPISQHLIEKNLQRLIARRNAVSVVSMLSLLWSASSVFNTLSYNINLAWPVGQRRNIVQNRLLAFASIGVFVFLLWVSLFVDAAINIAEEFWSRTAVDIPWNTGSILRSILPPLAIYLMLVGLYRWVPKKRARWRAVFFSAMLAAAGWQIVVKLFTWYLGSGLVHYNIIYGSLGTVVALLLLMYSLNLMVLFGAHLCAAIEAIYYAKEKPSLVVGR